jgi:alpha-glucosidase
MLALPGSACLYQGEELGLWEVEDLPAEALHDPIWERSGRLIRGRDGCRVPLPWSGDAPPFGFSPPGTPPWLPQPAAWRDLTAEDQAGDPASMLELYRAALRLRREHPGFASEELRWLPSPPATLLFERGDGLRCGVNLSAAPLPLVAGGTTLLTSGEIAGDLLGVDEAAWFRAP